MRSLRRVAMRAGLALSVALALSMWTLFSGDAIAENAESKYNLPHEEAVRIVVESTDESIEPTDTTDAATTHITAETTCECTESTNEAATSTEDTTEPITPTEGTTGIHIGISIHLLVEYAVEDPTEASISTADTTKAETSTEYTADAVICTCTEDTTGTATEDTTGTATEDITGTATEDTTGTATEDTTGTATEDSTGTVTAESGNPTDDGAEGKTSAANLSTVEETDGVTSSASPATTTPTAIPPPTTPPVRFTPRPSPPLYHEVPLQLGFNSSWDATCTSMSTLCDEYKDAVKTAVNESFQGCPGYSGVANDIRFSKLNDLNFALKQVAAVDEEFGPVVAEYNVSIDALESMTNVQLYIEDTVVPKLVQKTIRGDLIDVDFTTIATNEDVASFINKTFFGGDDYCEEIRTNNGCSICPGCAIDYNRLQPFCSTPCQGSNQACRAVVGKTIGNGVQVTECACKDNYLPVSGDCVHQNLIIGLSAGIGGALLLILLIATIVLSSKLCQKPKQVEYAEPYRSPLIYQDALQTNTIDERYGSAPRRGLAATGQGPAKDGPASLEAVELEEMDEPPPRATTSTFAPLGQSATAAEPEVVAPAATMAGKDGGKEAEDVGREWENAGREGGRGGQKASAGRVDDYQGLLRDEGGHRHEPRPDYEVPTPGTTPPPVRRQNYYTPPPVRHQNYGGMDSEVDNFVPRLDNVDPNRSYQIRRPTLHQLPAPQNAPSQYYF